jgi:hypothetical protein
MYDPIFQKKIIYIFIASLLTNICCNLVPSIFLPNLDIIIVIIRWNWDKTVYCPKIEIAILSISETWTRMAYATYSVHLFRQN